MQPIVLPMWSARIASFDEVVYNEAQSKGSFPFDHPIYFRS